jgi:hypothetical protein
VSAAFCAKASSWRISDWMTGMRRVAARAAAKSTSTTFSASEARAV